MNRFSLKMMKTMDLCTFELNIFFIRFLLRVSVCVCFALLTVSSQRQSQWYVQSYVFGINLIVMDSISQ